MDKAGEGLFQKIAELGDIAEPPPVSMVPATWAWVVLGVSLLVLAGVAAWLWLRHRRATAYRRAALAELRALTPAMRAKEASALGQVQLLLRRTALTAFPRGDIASLSGMAWSDFLTRTGGHFGEIGPVLAGAPYQPVADFDAPAVLAAARHWIRHHHA